MARLPAPTLAALDFRLCAWRPPAASSLPAAACTAAKEHLSEDTEAVRRAAVEQSRWLDVGQAGDLLLILLWNAILAGDRAEAEAILQTSLDAVKTTA